MCFFILHAYLFSLGCTEYIVEHTNKHFLDKEFGLHELSRISFTSILYHIVIIGNTQNPALDIIRCFSIHTRYNHSPKLLPFVCTVWFVLTSHTVYKPYNTIAKKFQSVFLPLVSRRTLLWMDFSLSAPVQTAHLQKSRVLLICVDPYLPLMYHLWHDSNVSSDIWHLFLIVALIPAIDKEKTVQIW